MSGMLQVRSALKLAAVAAAAFVVADTPAQSSTQASTAVALPLVASVAGERPSVASALALGRRYTEEFTSGHVGALWEKFSPQMKRTLDREGLRRFHVRIRFHAGRPLRLLDESVVGWLGSDIYQRTVQFSLAKNPVDIRWTLDASGQVLGFTVRPHQEAAPSPNLAYQTHTRLQLPFKGTWFVFWGGRTLLENYHAVDRVQRFAYDFVVAKDGKTSSGRGRRNSDFYCYGQAILSPAAGNVVSVANDVAENRPGKLNERRPLGNYVMIAHGDGEFSVLAHLQPGSVTVKRGQAVSGGEVIGRCGNSGRSSEPHLHFHLQSAPHLGKGHGLPAQFETYLADGQLIERGEPQRGTVLQTIADGTE